MCTRFVYNGIDKIVGFNFDIDLSVWDHTVITEENRFYIGIKMPDGMYHSFHGINKNGNVGTLLYVHGNENARYIESEDCITISELTEKFIKAEISFDKALDIVKKKKIIYAPDATMQAMLSDKKGRVLIIEPGIGYRYEQENFSLITNYSILKPDITKPYIVSGDTRYEVAKELLAGYDKDLNKIEEIFKQCWQLNYSPLPFEGWTNNRFIEENIKTGELNKQPVFQIGKPSFSKIRVAVANIQMDISNFDQAVMRKPNRSYRRYQQIAELVNTAVREKADMLVMPEACTPKEWLPTLARTCEKNHLAVVTGVEHIIEDNCVYNLTAVILPYEEKWTGQWHSVILYHSKNHFAPEEKRMVESLHLRAMEGIESSEAKCDAKYELYSWNGFWFTVYCCFELTSIRDRSIFQSYIDALIAVEWNQDVNYYSNIIESLSRDIHCYCIQTNTSEYGNSRITKPSKTENKDILRIKGGSNATAHVGTIDLEQLREFQMKAYSGQKEDKTFKPTPPDFDYKGAYERRKGTMFECFCAKKKAD